MFIAGLFVAEKAPTLPKKRLGMKEKEKAEEREPFQGDLIPRRFPPAGMRFLFRSVRAGVGVTAASVFAAFCAPYAEALREEYVPFPYDRGAEGSEAARHGALWDPLRPISAAPLSFCFHAVRPGPSDRLWDHAFLYPLIIVEIRNGERFLGIRPYQHKKYGFELSFRPIPFIC